MTALVFLDTETLGLNLDDPIWEIGLIRREPDGAETTHHFFLADPDGAPLEVTRSVVSDDVPNGNIAPSGRRLLITADGEWVGGES